MPDRHSVLEPPPPLAVIRPDPPASAAEQLTNAARLAADRLTTSRLAAARVAAARLETARRTAAEQIAAEQVAAADGAAAELAAAEALAGERLATAERTAAEQVATAEQVAAAEQAAASDHLAAAAAAALRLGSAKLAAAEQLTTERMAAAEQVAQARLAAAVSAAEQLGVARLVAAERLAAELVAAEELVDAQHAAGELAAAEQVAAAQLTAAAALAAASIADAEEIFRLAMDHSAVGTCLVSPAGRFTRVNPALCTMLNRTADALEGLAWADITHPGDLEKLMGLVAGLLAGERASFRTLSRFVAPDGSVLWGDASVAAVLNADGTVRHEVAQILDVTDRVNSEREWAQLATHDALTGLANRTAMLDEIELAVRAGRRSGRMPAVLLLDLDHFKDVNDSLGHNAGDELLKVAGQRIASVVREGDLTARLGGDEFVVVMRELDDAAEAVRTGWRLVRAFREPFTTPDGELYATASIGVALASDTGSIGSDDLLREADTAMYVAKAEGRDRLSVFNEELRASLTGRLLIEGELRQALAREELVVWYQPEVDLATGRMIAVEALLRWHHPTGELYTADRFIQVAEETGLILDIGAWVLHRACDQAARWATERPDRALVVRVNVSTLQLAEAGLLDVLDAAIASSGVDPSLLCVEITETALLRETDTVRRNLHGIHERGVKIAIDDFGTGYASLTYLRRYPVDVLKIDRSFVTHIASNDFDRRLVAGIMALVGHLEISVTAEGVESPEQAASLLGLGCRGAQGFLYSKAVPPGDVDALLDTTFATT